MRIRYTFLISALAAGLAVLSLQLHKERTRQLQLIKEMWYLGHRSAVELQSLRGEADSYVMQTKEFRRKYRSELDRLSDYYIVLSHSPSQLTAEGLVQQLKGNIELIEIPADTTGHYATLVAMDLIFDRVNQIVASTKPKIENVPPPIPVLRNAQDTYPIGQTLVGKFDFFYTIDSSANFSRAIVDQSTILKPNLPLHSPHKLRDITLFVKNPMTKEETAFTAKFE